MGIISFIKGGVAELAIARPDTAKDQWVYKHPDQTIPMKAQLTVDSDEVALFFKDGKFVGSFSAGRHTLDASNIPFLGQLVDKFTGGNVFICEVYFVTTREMPSISGLMRVQTCIFVAFHQTKNGVSASCASRMNV